MAEEEKVPDSSEKGIANSEAINDTIMKKIENFCNEMNPYVDSVQVFATKHESNEKGTTRFTYGVGNQFAIVGQVEQWIRNSAFVERIDEGD